MTRRYDLDTVRIGALFLLIVYHVSLMFGSRTFFINSPDRHVYFDAIHVLSHPWRMGLLFFISGVATAFALDRLSPGELRGKRSRQLLLPFTLGVLFLIPPQLYVYFNTTTGQPIGMLEVFVRYLTLTPFDLPDGSQTLIVTMEHLWYLAYLWVYTTIVIALMAAARNRVAGVGDWLSARLSGMGLLVWPAALFVLLRLTLRPVFPPTINLVDDWYSHAMYLSCFLGGVMLAHQAEFWRQIARMRAPALMVALSCAVFLLYRLDTMPLQDQDGWNSVEMNLVLGPFRWCVIVAILGYAQMLRSWRPPGLAYLSRAMLTYYVLHQPLMLLIAYWLHTVGALGTVTFVPIVVLTLAACALIYEGWRRLCAMVARPQLAGL